MKTIYLLSTCLTFLLTVLFSANLSSQATDVGYLKNGKPYLSSLAMATTILKGGLKAGATVTDVYIDQEPATGKYFLIGTVRNETISGKAIELEIEGEFLRVTAGGPGLEITCTGVNCSECIPVIQKWKVRCECKDNPARPNSECNMSSKVIITPW